MCQTKGFLEAKTPEVLGYEISSMQQKSESLEELL